MIAATVPAGLLALLLRLCKPIFYMPPISFSLAFFLGTFLETLLVGLFIPLLIVASYAQWKRVSMGRKINLVMAFTTVFFGLTIFAHWILGMRRTIFAALYRPSRMTVDQYLLPPYSADEVVRRAIFQFQAVVGDIIMVYRMYHIYNKSLLVCVIPSITTAGLFAIGCGFTNQVRDLSSVPRVNANNDWTTAGFCVTLFNSAFMSAAIIFRLWRVHREAPVSDANTREPIILRALRVLVESATLWTLSVLMAFLAFLAKSDLRHTFVDISGPMAGISFCLIIVRLWTITPEVRGDSWECSQRSRISRMQPFSDSRLPNLPILLDRVKVERNIYVGKPEGAAMGFRVVAPTSPDDKESSADSVE